ncbi:MAG: hypothetical protein ABIV47_28045 [Roseiflexaceae bacterium]
MRRVIKRIVTTITTTTWTITWLEDEPASHATSAPDQPNALPPTHEPSMQPEAAQNVETHHERDPSIQLAGLDAADAPAGGLRSERGTHHDQ